MSLPDLNDLSIVETAAYILFHVWNKCTPLSTCLDALRADPVLHDALKEAHVKREYESIRRWSKTVRKPTPPPSLESQLSTLLHALVPALKTFSRTRHPIGLWTPSPTLPSHIQVHVQNLAIPTLHGRPSLLLHNLQSPSPEIQSRVKDIFTPGIHTFLINTSGSGKTRLLLSGLCAHWGVYLTSLIDTSHIGSADLQNALTVHVPCSSGFGPLPKATSSRYEEAKKRNMEIAEVAIKRVLLARLIVFKEFLENVKEEEEKKKWLWLILQLHPAALHPHLAIYDIFEHISRLLPTSLTYLNAHIDTLLCEIRKVLFKSATSSPAPQIYIIIDEAQHAASLHTSSFPSSRPILHPLLHTLTLLSSSHGLTLLLSGTGVSQSAITTAISNVLKDTSYRFLSCTGAFSPSTQLAYLESYFPKGYLETPHGKRLKERCWYWLQGRYRFTTGYIAEVLLRGFGAPHRTLSGYVGWVAGMSITDARDIEEKEGKEREWSGERLDFEKLSSHPAMLQTIRTLTTHALLRPDAAMKLGEDEDTFVQLGFARFSSPPPPSSSSTKTTTRTSASASTSSETTSIEPLVLLSSARWMTLATHHRILASDVGKHDPGDGKNGWEAYLAFFFPLLFSPPSAGKKKKVRLRDIFDFHGTVPPWAGEEGEVVALFRSGEGEVEVNAANMFHPTTPSTSSHALATPSSTPQHTLLFLHHRTPAPICFPHKAMGPDILFVLRLSSGTHLWVVIQAKFSNGTRTSKMIPLSVLKGAVRSITPSQFYLTRDTRPFSPSTYPNLIPSTLDALKSLPEPTPGAGKYSLLRVLACFPAHAGMGRLSEEEADGGEEGEGPLALLNMERVKEVTRRLSPVEFLGRLESGKRKRGGEGAGGGGGKRRKLKI